MPDAPASHSGHWMTRGRWSPYVAGAGIGVLSWITFAFMGKGLGTSTTFVHVAGALEGIVARDHVESTGYYASAIVGKPIVDWQFALVVSLFFGALLAAKLSRSTFVEHVPALWSWRFGPSRTKRAIVAFAGGAILLYGARMAGGCTSGHAITGGLQLAVSSWSFLIAMFVAGIGMAFLLFGKAGRQHV
ncbi:MAG: YeeE/YedE family protein [Phycisphaeraceae bacterium]|nr:YeeE/YedE family protein [Phycisphaeraceae bacterium]